MSTFSVPQDIMQLQNGINVILNIIKTKDTSQYICDTPARESLQQNEHCLCVAAGYKQKKKDPT